MNKEVKEQIKSISTELIDLADTFKALDTTCVYNGMSLSPQALHIPTKYLEKLSDELHEIVVQLHTEKEQTQ